MTAYIGTNGNDTLVGLDDVSDDLTGKLGNDVLIGGDGFVTDWVHYDNAPAAVTVNLAAGTATGGDGNDTLNGIEGVTGSKFNDTLRSGAGFESSILYGGAGNDALIGNTGFNSLKGGAGNDALTGGDGFDSADYSDATSAVTVNLSTGTATGGAGNDTLAGIEQVVGSSFNDTLVGVSNAFDFGVYLQGGKGNDSIVGSDNSFNQLEGGEGKDSLIGGNSDDTLIGGLGADVLTGGEGWDTIDYFDALSSVTVNLENGTASGGAGNDILRSIEQVSGSSYNDTLIGGTGDNSLWGLDGNDVLVGGDGFDNLEGDFGNDTLTGGAGDDQLNGGWGDDVLTGGKGNDWANFFEGSVAVNLAKGTATGAAGKDTLQEIENVNGSFENDTLIGDANANTLNGGQGNDWLTGGQGDDTLIGYKDVDWASYSDATSAVTVDLIAGTATGGAGNDILQEIENVQGSKFGDTLKGDDLKDNILDGGAGNDKLDGKQGQDALTGGAGNDIFKFTVNGPADKITDFNVTNDTIQLENGVFKALTATGVLAADQFKVGAKAADANDFVIYNKAAGALLYDADGNGANEAIQIATVGTGLNMTNADIVII
ncbi:calcium-binding protein [Nitrosomonas sp. JL21]|uniref:calcium-binding protein n=1 Tax=Nitrosomonas sp. JL21 TaxID=153949 RepID=UPI001368ABFC|nr:calcium-binding protein [Nitrosomonas sp. JL21]MBL8498862.1 calcium-binding protein [Nitrosomonas sp.]MXS78580.1 calcium-binding protein [Nitrosomonas sp. JL21]